MTVNIEVPVILEANNSVYKHVVTTCEQGGRKASVFCHHKRIQGLVDWTVCAASFELNAKRFVVCEEFDQLFAGDPFSIAEDGHEAVNLGPVQDLWPKAMSITGTYGMINLIGAVSLIGKQRRQVDCLCDSTGRNWITCGFCVSLSSCCYRWSWACCRFSCDSEAPNGC